MPWRPGAPHSLERAEVELIGVVPEEHLAPVVLFGAAGHQVQGGCGRPDDPVLLQPGVPGIQDGLDHELKLRGGRHTGDRVAELVSAPPAAMALIPRGPSRTGRAASSPEGLSNTITTVVTRFKPTDPQCSSELGTANSQGTCPLAHPAHPGDSCHHKHSGVLTLKQYHSGLRYSQNFHHALS